MFINEYQARVQMKERKIKIRYEYSISALKFFAVCGMLEKTKTHRENNKNKKI